MGVVVILAMKFLISLFFLFTFLHSVTLQRREVFSWTRGLKRGGGGQRSSHRSDDQHQVEQDKSDRASRAPVRTGYGYTRGSQEVANTQIHRRVPSKSDRNVLENRRSPKKQRPKMSLASALDILKRNGEGLAQKNRNTIQNINLRQSQRGRKVAEIPGQSGQLPAGSNAPGPSGYGYTRGSQEFLENRGSPTRTVKKKTTLSQGLQLRQGSTGRHVPPIPTEYEYYDDYGEIYQDYGYDQDYPEVTGNTDETSEEERYGANRDERYGAREEKVHRARENERYDAREEEVPNHEDDNGEEIAQDETDDGECGPECRNLLHELEHPKEDSRCPNAGMVIDIWGYCRYIFHEERRDWSWWENMRTFVLGGGNSWYNSYRPTAYEEG